MDSVKFKVIVPGYNAYPWIERNLQVLEDQTYKKIDVCVVNDASTDPRHGEVVDEYCGRNGWLAVHNEENMGGLYNIVHSIEKLKCDDDDVIVVIDGDDWLYNELVFESLAEVYKRDKILLSYSDFIRYRTGDHRYTKPPKRHLLRRGVYRKPKHKWIFSQLRSWRYKLWKNIKHKDLKSPAGEYWRVTWDQAFWFPMVEMARTRVVHIPRILYVFNDNNENSDYRVRQDEQVAAEKIIRALPRYKKLKL